MRLSDFFMPLIAFVRSYEHAQANSPQEVAQTLDAMVQQARTDAVNAGVDVELFQQGLFPIAAWADERIALLGIAGDQGFNLFCQHVAEGIVDAFVDDHALHVDARLARLVVAAKYDPSERMIEILQALRGQVTILLVEHDMPLVMGVCDRILVINRGQPIALGTPAEVKADESVIEAYLGEDYEFA